MKQVICILGLIMCVSVSWAKDADPCEASALNAAKKYAHSQKYQSGGFTLQDSDTSPDGLTNFYITMSYARGNGDCWVNIIIKVKEPAESSKSCQIIEAGEDESADSCS
jgi:hypothetical protein